MKMSPLKMLVVVSSVALATMAYAGDDDRSTAPARPKCR